MALVDEGFSNYAVISEGALRKLEELVTQFIVTCNDKSSVAEANYVMYGDGLRVAVAFFKGWGVVTS